jgi:hypothetical protein
LEREEVTQRMKILKQVVQGVHNNIPEVPMEVDIPLEERFTNISEAIHKFHMKIIEFESCQTPSTPLEEREKREMTMIATMDNIRSMEVECSKL